MVQSFDFLISFQHFIDQHKTPTDLLEDVISVKTFGLKARRLIYLRIFHQSRSFFSCAILNRGGGGGGQYGGEPVWDEQRGKYIGECQ